MNKGMMIGVGAAVVLAGLIAFAAGGGETGADDPDHPYGVVTIEGSLPAYSDQVDAAVGQPMPVATGTNLTGEPLTLRPTGRAQAILFLAHWCSHCQAEVPEIQAWLDDTGGVEGVDIVSVATGIDPGRPNYSPVDWLAREGWEPATLWDDQSSAVVSAFGGSSQGPFPFWVFVDADGSVMGRIGGRVGGEQLENILLSLAG
jgi:thiol-disulfide isomerase/thioredoxin